MYLDKSQKDAHNLLPALIRLGLLVITVMDHMSLAEDEEGFQVFSYTVVLIVVETVIQVIN